MGNFRLVSGLYVKALEDMKADVGDGVLLQGQVYQCMVSPRGVLSDPTVAFVGVNGLFNITKLDVELLYQLPKDSR